MLRTKRSKKKPRSASRTLLMYGEGLDEEMFLKHLRRLYSRDNGVAVTIRNGKGGAATDIITNAINEPGLFDRRIVILDNDKSKQEMNEARVKAKQLGVVLLENTPCLEAMLLSILRPGQNFSSKTTAWCKREFGSNYLNEKKQTEITEYGKFFPKETLEERRTVVCVLNILIDHMENKG